MPVDGVETPQYVNAELSDAPKYGGSRQLFRDAALNFGVDLTEQEYTNWRYLIGGACIVDHLVDVEKADIVPAITNIFDGNFRQDLSLRMQLMIENFMWLSPQQKQVEILNSIERVGELASLQRSSTDPKDIVKIRTEEADIFSKLLALDLNSEPDDLARQKFNDWLFSWSRTGYLFDTFIDVSKDFKNGESGVLPTQKARLIYAGAMGKEAKSALKKTPPALLGKCALNGFKYVVLGIKLKPND